MSYFKYGKDKPIPVDDNVKNLYIRVGFSEVDEKGKPIEEAATPAVEPESPATEDEIKG